MAKIKLDSKDRLILLGQFRILEKIDPDNKGDYQRAAKIIEYGYESYYDSIGGPILDPVTEQVCEEVHNILEMYRWLGQSYDGLADKSGIDAHDVKFRGFDGNNETDHLCFGEFLTSEGKYEESPVFNSHSQVIEMYRRMLKEFEQVKNEYPLGKADIQRILAAMIHPSRR